jgi:hypothetical protein
MALNDNLYALSRWTQDVMNNFDEDSTDEALPWEKGSGF